MYKSVNKPIIYPISYNLAILFLKFISFIYIFFLDHNIYYIQFKNRKLLNNAILFNLLIELILRFTCFPLMNFHNHFIDQLKFILYLAY